MASDASRISVSPRPSRAAEASPRSLSEKDRKTIGAGVWPRSMALSASSIVRVVVRSRCMNSGHSRRDRGAVKTCLANDNETPLTWFILMPRPIELLPEPPTDALDQKPHGLT